MKVGFIGQGWIGKNYANDFEARGYAVTRYALEEPYRANKAAIVQCDIVFIAVPTPTKPEGFDDSLVRDALTLIGEGKIAVIKSTILPRKTEELQRAFPHLYVLHSPEFLVQSNAAHDAAHPERNIIGIPLETREYREKAQTVLDLLPRAPYERIMSARDAEFVKYAGNCFLFAKVMYMNILFDLVKASGADWEAVREAMIHDPRISESHTNPVHASGRGAGGGCFIKDFEAFRRLYEETVGDVLGLAVLNALKEKNLGLLIESQKDLALIESVYGGINILE
ncbi:MAG TPA: hypothetical protein VMU27_02095 [Candidatus Paceibacterota bacterium]|nr:hypothetical protein [Candidatus Paceibacterota bacterium]